MKKTNAVRILDRLKIGYQLIEYDVDESDLSAIHVASTAQLPIGQVYKTLVLQGDKNGIFVSIIPGADEIDLKKAALESSNKKVALIAMKDLEPLTGYIRGGCSPLGMKKTFPVYIDKSAFDLPFIYISAGIRGMQIKIAPADLKMVCKAEMADIKTEKPDHTA
jgi:Cys-tRNA(Pro)/Cys-tRNA(Cys) deacylase